MTIKQSETIVIKRSQINFAPYNPRIDDPNVVETIKQNVKKVAFLGGVVWNPASWNLVSGHKRLQALDIIYRYDGSAEKDYDIKVEAFEMDEKTEREQNIFMNAQSAQGVFDMRALAELLPEIDYKNAGLTDSDLEMIALEVPSFDFGDPSAIIEDIMQMKQPLQARKDAEKEQRKEDRAQISAEKAEETRLQNKAIQQEQKREMKATTAFEQSVKSYVTLSFSSAENKLAFMNRFGFEATSEFIKGESFSDMIERVK